MLHGSLTEISEKHRRLVVAFDARPERAPAVPGLVTLEGRGSEWILVSQGSVASLASSLGKVGGRIVDDRVATLEEIFAAYSRCPSPLSIDASEG